MTRTPAGGSRRWTALALQAGKQSLDVGFPFLRHDEQRAPYPLIGAVPGKEPTALNPPHHVSKDSLIHGYC